MANSNYRLEFFAGEFNDPTGHGEGQNFIGSIDVLTDGNGDVAFASEFPVELGLEQAVTATATDPDGNTSEFSLERAVGGLDIDADISVTQSYLPEPGQQGNPVTFIATITNLGPNPATGVTLTNDILINDATFVSAAPAQGSCDYFVDLVTYFTDQLVCNIGDLPPGGTVDVEISRMPVNSGYLYNTVEAFANQPDTETGNNRHTLEAEIVPSADAEIIKSARPLIVADGAAVTYTLQVVNKGPSRIWPIEVVDEIPQDSASSQWMPTLVSVIHQTIPLHADHSF